MAPPRSTLGHYRGESLTHPMLITVLFGFRTKGHREPPNKVGSSSPAKRLVEFEAATFRFYHHALIHHDTLPNFSQFNNCNMKESRHTQNSTSHFEMFEILINELDFVIKSEKSNFRCIQSWKSVKKLRFNKS